MIAAPAAFLSSTSLPASRYGADFNLSPLIVFFEVTRSCDLVCRHCRAKAQPKAHPEQLSTVRAMSLIEDLARFPAKPILVFTGGDPFKREDLFQLIAHAARGGLEVAVTPSATPLATRERIGRAKEAGAVRFAVSLDGASAATHDKFRGWSGSFDRTFDMLKDARDAGLQIQVNTTISRLNAGELEAIAELIAPFGVSMWSLFFMVPVGRALPAWMLSADETERMFQRIETLSRSLPFAIKTTEAPHYRRFVLQGALARGERIPEHMRRPGTRDGQGVMFVSHTGEICPSGFLPEVCGRFPDHDPVEIYQLHPTFLALRQPRKFGGKCGRCGFNTLCGGSRARAHAMTGDALGSDPACAYQPEAA